ncbi:MAG TPA: BON domain-containing protein [Paraburkholderia sp.]|nr:BON domain-containing protein [Paraburkholderia sp.]
MKAVQFIKLASGAVIALACLNVQAQPGSAGSAAQVASNPGQSASGLKANNRQLAKDVRLALKKAKHEGFRFSNITVRANSCVVSLTGSVPSADQIEVATSIARSVPGVESVDNRLVVRREMSGFDGQ